MSQDLLRKYIRYAKHFVHPKLTDLDTDKISKLYVELREQSARTGGIPIAVRHVESIMRCAEAHAKMHLRSEVRSDDVDMALRVILESFIGAQKFQIQNQLRKRFQRYITYRKDNNELLFFLLKSLVLETIQSQAFASGEDTADTFTFEAHQRDSVDIPFADILDRAKEYSIFSIDAFLSSSLLRDSGFVVDQENYCIRKLPSESI
jgi:DNA replication licensing factor MCM2